MKPIRTTAPETSLLNPRFKYVPAAKTDIRRLFKRLRAQEKTNANPDRNDAAGDR